MPPSRQCRRLPLWWSWMPQKLPGCTLAPRQVRGRRRRSLRVLPATKNHPREDQQAWLTLEGERIFEDLASSAGISPIHHKKQKLKMCPNNNHETQEGQGVFKGSEKGRVFSQRARFDVPLLEGAVCKIGRSQRRTSMWPPCGSSECGQGIKWAWVGLEFGLTWVGVG